MGERLLPGTEEPSNLLLATRDFELNSRQSPHVYSDEFFSPESYAELLGQYPSIGAHGERGGNALYWGDEACDRHLDRTAIWKRGFNFDLSPTDSNHDLEFSGHLALSRVAND